MTDMKDFSKDFTQFVTEARDRLLTSMNLAPRRSGIVMAAQGIGFFAAGAIIGGGLALLFAPTSGAEMRRSLAGFFTRSAKKVSDTVDHQASAMEAEGGASKPGSRASHQA